MDRMLPDITAWKNRRRPNYQLAVLRFVATGIPLFLLLLNAAAAQVSVLTAHNDTARTGQNTSEAALTPANVNPAQFGRLFSQAVDGQVFAQPLYVPRVIMANGKGTHNVVYVATYNDAVYAFDADNNGGINAGPLWQVSLLTNTTPAGTYTSLFGVQGTPVIDASTDPSDPMAQTLFLVSSEVKRGGADIFRLHALDITSGAEKFGGPFVLQTTLPGTGSGSSGGSLTFDPQYHRQRAGLLLLNQVLYVPLASINDVGPWHGWIFSYTASSNPGKGAAFRQLSAFCTSANGAGAGIWMGGAGLAGEVNNPAKPYGRIFVSTGNGSFGVYPPSVPGQPFSNPANQYGMSMLDLDLTGGVMTVQDEFTPFNQAALNSQDGDFGSGGPLLLPAQTTASGKTLHPLVQIGKSGMIYILNRDNQNDGSSSGSNAYSPAGLGGFNSGGDQVVQEVQTPIAGAQGWGAGVWGSPAYWNNTIYFGGTSPGLSSSLTAYSFSKGALSTAPVSASSDKFIYPGPTPSVSANGNSNGILWVLDNHAYVGGGSGALLAYDATNLGNLLYSSNANLVRDTPGSAVPYTVPTIANGKVYVGATNTVAWYGLLGSVPSAPPPVISPGSGSFTGSRSIAIADAIAGATIYYTTDGSLPGVNSNLYTGPFSIASSQTITAIASATGYLQSSPVSATFSSTSNAANPVFSLTSGTYAGPQTLTLSDASPSSAIYYTVDGVPPTTQSTLYTGPIRVAVSETVRAIALAPNLQPSSVVSAAYTITPLYAINFSHGFAQAQSSGGMQFNGSTGLDDFRLQLTTGGRNQSGSAFATSRVDVRQFTTDFTFQLSNPLADGFTFTIQGAGPGALGGPGAGLGYVTIPRSVAIKFDLYNNAGEGVNSTGIYSYGNLPTVPSVSLAGTPIDLHNGNYTNAHLTYDGVTLTLTLTNPISLGSWSHGWAINIPAIVGSSTAWIGFTGGSGGLSSSQKITSWTYVAGVPAVPNYPAGFSAAGLYLTGAWVNQSSLQLTSGGAYDNNSAFYSSPVNIQAFTTDFDFRVLPNPTDFTGDGFTFTLQNAGLPALGAGGGGLGYAGIPNSMAIKFDTYNNSGEGSDSTGLYLNGANPTLPALNLAANQVVLASGDLMHAHITYDGSLLTWRIQDMSAPDPEIFSNQVAINLPHTIGSNTAYVGFTGASGAATSIQDILNWTFSNPH